MSTLNGYAVVKASTMTTKNPDKNGFLPVILDVKGGSIPSYRTISGTIAQREGIYEDGVYLVEWKELPANEYGRQFQFSKLDELKGVEIIRTCKDCGPARLIDVSPSAVVETEEASAETTAQ